MNASRKQEIGVGILVLVAAVLLAVMSIPGIVTFKKAEDMREVATHVPLDSFFIETDSPFLTPVPFRGKRNEPARVGLVAQKIGELRGIDASVVADATWRNASQFFGLTEAH